MWAEGDVIVRREVLNDGRAWLELPVVVVRDEPKLLATYIAEGTPFHFPAGAWPTPSGRHPWHGRTVWEGHGVLMLQRPGDAHAIWVFWHGPAREFTGWYVNLQEPFRRTETGYDTQDLELDIWVPVGGQLGMEGCGRARGTHPRRPLHRGAGRGDLGRGTARRRRTGGRPPLVGPVVGALGARPGLGELGVATRAKVR